MSKMAIDETAAARWIWSLSSRAGHPGLGHGAAVHRLSSLRCAPFRWREMAPWRSLRLAVGVVAPLLVGQASGHLDYGAFAALGAVPAGFVSFQGVTRSRVAAVAAASLGMAVSTFVGATLAIAAPWLLVPVVVVWGYVVGLVVCLGQRVSVAAVQWAVAMMIAIGIPMAPGEAALRAGLVLAGALFQGLLVAVSWTVDGDREGAALAASYRTLAAYASQLAAGEVGPPASADFPAVAQLADPSPLLRPATRSVYAQLLEGAESLRASIAALGLHTGDDAASRRFAAGVARVLDAFAGVLRAGGTERGLCLLDLDRALGQLVLPGPSRWSWVGDATLEDLRRVRAVLDQRETATPRFAHGLPHSSPKPTAHIALRSLALTLRANLSPATEAGRHALRMAAATGAAEVLVQVTGLFEGRWVILTMFLVLKPDYTTTLSRSIHRAVGTALGAGLGAALAAVLHPGSPDLFVVTGMAMVAAYALFQVNYLLSSAFLTLFIVVILEMLGLRPGATATARLLDTAIGAGLALGAYLVWPTWHRQTAHAAFGRLLAAHGDYVSALLRALDDPGDTSPGELRTLQVTARRARSDAEASAARLADEPARPPLTPAAASALVAAVARLAHAELALHTFSSSRGDGGRPQCERGASPPGLVAAAAECRAAMTALAQDASDLQRSIGGSRPSGASRPPDHPRPTARRPLQGITDDVVEASEALEAVVRALHTNVHCTSVRNKATQQSKD